MSKVANDWYQDMLKLNVDGVVFYPIGQNPYDKDCEIHCQYTTEEFKDRDVEGFPRSNWAYYKMIGKGRIVYLYMNGNVIKERTEETIQDDALKQLNVNMKVEAVRAELSCLNCVLDHNVIFKNTDEIDGDIRHLKMGTQVLSNCKCEHCGCNSFNTTLFYSVKIE